MLQLGVKQREYLQTLHRLSSDLQLLLSGIVKLMPSSPFVVCVPPLPRLLLNAEQPQLLLFGQGRREEKTSLDDIAGGPLLDRGNVVVNCL